MPGGTTLLPRGSRHWRGVQASPASGSSVRSRTARAEATPFNSSGSSNHSSDSRTARLISIAKSNEDRISGRAGTRAAPGTQSSARRTSDDPRDQAGSALQRRPAALTWWRKTRGPAHQGARLPAIDARTVAARKRRRHRDSQDRPGAAVFPGSGLRARSRTSRSSIVELQKARPAAPG